MQNLVTINNQHLEVREYNGQRVVTFKDIDRVHGRAEGTASRNFRTNKKRFIEGEDYYKITPNEFRRAIGNMDKRQQNDITLVTETGYLMLAKSLHDDLAWSVQRQLVNTYFNHKDLTQNKPAPVEELTTKHYKGQPVVTISDIALVSGKSPFEIRYHVNNALIRGTDYYFLTGNELDKFKDENKSISRMASSLIVINKQGFIKLVKVMQGIPQLPCFKNALPEPKVPTKHFNYAKGLRVDIPDNREAQELIRDLKQKAMALLELLKQVSMYTVDEEYLATIKVINSLGSRISSSCGDFKRIKYKLKEIYL